MTDQHDDLRTIKDTNTYLRSLIETPENVKDYFWISGSVKGKYKSDFGHTYFSLEDEQHSISCMLSKRYQDKAIYITNGTMLDVYGVLGVYEQQAKITFHAHDVQVVRLDDSKLDKSAIEQLEEKGLYPLQKKDLPFNPKYIAIITSKQSRALSDFENIYREQNGRAVIQLADTLMLLANSKNPYLEFVFTQINPAFALNLLLLGQKINSPTRPTLLQGEQAINLIVQRIEEINRDAKADIIVLTRGGGGHEDLATFNSFIVAEAICNSRIPIVTGIGHQRDETIADRVADQKTISPTDAAYKLAQLSERETPIQVTAPPQSTEQAVENNIEQAKQNNAMMMYLIIAVIGIIGLIIALMLFLQS